jgi:hypothetical protein
MLLVNNLLVGLLLLLARGQCRLLPSLQLRIVPRPFPSTAFPFRKTAVSASRCTRSCGCATTAANRSWALPCASRQRPSFRPLRKRANSPSLTVRPHPTRCGERTKPKSTPNATPIRHRTKAPRPSFVGKRPLWENPTRSPSSVLIGPLVRMPVGLAIRLAMWAPTRLPGKPVRSDTDESSFVGSSTLASNIELVVCSETSVQDRLPKAVSTILNLV